MFLYIFKTFSRRKANDFVLTSLRAATQTFPSGVIDFFNELFLYTNNVFYFEMCLRIHTQDIPMLHLLSLTLHFEIWRMNAFVVKNSFID